MNREELANLIYVKRTERKWYRSNQAWNDPMSSPTVNPTLPLMGAVTCGRAITLALIDYWYGYTRKYSPAVIERGM
jgi:hypothetical protein